MATVSFRVPDELKERMDEHPEVNWSAVLREQITEELEDRQDRELARAVLISERLSQSVDPDEARDQDSTDVIRKWRDTRYGPENHE